MSKNKTVSIILPTLNEQGNIIPLIDAIHHELDAVDHEILVIDDRSDDGTHHAVQKRMDTDVRLFINDQRVGLAKSIRNGLKVARGQYVVVMDSDFNHQPKYLRFMIQAMDLYDCAFASRFYEGGGMTNLWRQTLSRSFNIFIQLSTGSYIKDNLYGYFIIKREIIHQCPLDDIFWGYGDYCMRLLYILQKNKRTILQFPAVNGLRKYGQGNTRFFKTFFKYTAEVLKLSYKVHVQKYGA